MIVEDDPGMREALERVLSAAGFRVATYPSAEDLLDTGVSPEAVCWVFDIRLPGISGLELYRALTELGPTSPVIFMTAFDEPFVRQYAHKLGAAAYLIKPFGGRELVDAVNAAAGVNATS